MRCDPQNIKANIEASDKDTLLVISEGLHFYMAQGEERATLNMVLNGVDHRSEELIWTAGQYRTAHRPCGASSGDSSQKGKR